MKRPNPHKEIRWVLVRNDEDGPHFLGRFCWEDATGSEPEIRTFSSRKAASAAQKTCCYQDTEIAKVTVLIS